MSQRWIVEHTDADGIIIGIFHIPPDFVVKDAAAIEILLK